MLMDVDLHKLEELATGVKNLTHDIKGENSSIKSRLLDIEQRVAKLRDWSGDPLTPLPGLTKSWGSTFSEASEIKTWLSGSITSGQRSPPIQMTSPVIESKAITSAG